MLVVRPITKQDYEALHTCAVESGHGFTSLPVNEELLTNRIDHSVYSFDKPEVKEPGDEGYLMVGFDSETGKSLGQLASRLRLAGMYRFIPITSVKWCIPHPSLASIM